MVSARTLPADVHPETLSRLPPVQRERLNEEQQKLYDAAVAPPAGRLNLAGIKGPNGISLRMPKLLSSSMGDVNRMLRSGLGLDAGLVEVAILATAREMKSQFEWAMHEQVALDAGVSEQTIDIIRHGRPLTGVPDAQAALIDLAREAVGAHKVSSPTYARALALFGEEDLLHYSLLIANYAQHAIMLAVVGQELHDNHQPGLPDSSDV